MATNDDSFFVMTSATEWRVNKYDSLTYRVTRGQMVTKIMPHSKIRIYSLLGVPIATACNNAIQSGFNTWTGFNAAFLIFAEY